MHLLWIYFNFNYFFYSLKGAEERKPIDFFLEILPTWINLGVKFIGGCCGFVAEDIKKLNKAINSEFK